MANHSLFKTDRGRLTRDADTTNDAGGQAYAFTPEHALAQFAVTGTFNDTFYSNGEAQLKAIKEAADQCSPEFIAQVAVYAREQGYMKDMPAALCVMLSKADPKLLQKVFFRCIDNGKQLRNFVQILRSGVFGRKSLGTRPKKLIQQWITERSDYGLFRASVGNKPSLADVIKLSRPRPKDDARSAFYSYLLGKPCNQELLPEIVKHYEAFKSGDRSAGVPNVDFRMLAGLPLTREDWAEIAKNGKWHQTRMNLNTYARHGVFDVPGMDKLVADKLRDTETIRKSKVFPYQLLAAFLNTGPEAPHRYYGYTRTAQPFTVEDGEVPATVRLALQDAMETAVDNVPAFEGNVDVIVDVSGSMGSPVTGFRQGATSKVRCVDVASLVAATVKRNNPLGRVIPVDTQVHRPGALNPRDSIMTNAQKLAAFGGGGTDLGAAMRYIESKKTRVPDLIIMVSDNESWVHGGYYGRATATMESFNRLKAKNPKLKMVCIDIVANATSQTDEQCSDVLNIGGFSDKTWTVIKNFVEGQGAQTWVDEIKAISLD